MIFEKWGGYGNSERRTQLWRQQVPPPGEARSDVWQMMEFSKRFTLAEVWGRQPVPGLKAAGFDDGALPDVLAEAERMGYRRAQTLYDVLFATPENRQFKWPDPVAQGHDNHTVIHAGIDWFPEKALFEDYARFGRGHGHDLAPFDVYFRDDVRGLRWPVVNGKETLWRFNEQYDPYARKGSGFDFYGDAMKALPSGDLDKVTKPEPTALAGKAKIFYRPYAAPAESPDAIFDLWLCTGRVLEHWHSGSMTRRVPDAATTRCRRRCSSCTRRMPRRAGLKQDDLAWIESRRGKIKARVETGRPQPHAARARLRALVRRGRLHQQGDARRDLPDLQGDGLQEVRGQDHQGVSEGRAMKTTVILSLAAVLAAGCSSSATTRDAVPAPSGPIADAELGPLEGERVRRAHAAGGEGQRQQSRRGSRSCRAPTSSRRRGSRTPWPTSSPSPRSRTPASTATR